MQTEIAIDFLRFTFDGLSLKQVKEMHTMHLHIYQI